jgi:hypothetical protein
MPRNVIAMRMGDEAPRLPAAHVDAELRGRQEQSSIVVKHLGRLRAQPSLTIFHPQSFTRLHRAGKKSEVKYARLSPENPFRKIIMPQGEAPSGRLLFEKLNAKIVTAGFGFSQRLASYTITGRIAAPVGRLAPVIVH